MTPTDLRMNAAPYKWSFFIAHASADAEVAEQLYERLAPNAPTFLDSRCIELGADWDLELARAQQDTLISVVLVSESTEEAYYQREEIAAAVALARAEGKKHRVVPVFLNAEAAASSKVPYGLRLKHGLTLSDDFGINEAAEELLDLLRRLRAQPGTATAARPRSRWRPRPAPAAWLYGGGALAIVALGGLAWFALGISDRPPDSATLPPSPTTPTVAQGDTAAGERCVKVEHFSPNVIPHYLLNSIGSENFPYWLKIAAKNDCTEARIMTLRFERGDNIALANPPQTHHFTIAAGTTSERIFNPRFDLASQQPDIVEIHWSVEDENRAKIDRDFIRAEIVAPLTIAWDLKKPSASAQRIPVEPEYLLSSLQAWILKPPRRVADLGRACRTMPASGVLLERLGAIKGCYRHLFSGDNAVVVSESPIRFPAGLRQRIRPPADLIEDRHNQASSLEAALLFAAVMDARHTDGVDFNLVMLVGPIEDTGDPEHKTAYIAWRDAGKPWSAIDLRLANARTFAENIATASSQVNTIISYNSEVADAIESKGAGFSKNARFAAINFRKVPPEYRIRALP